MSHQSVWNTQEQQKIQYSSEVTKYARLLLETPMVDWKARKGTYRMAPPYTLIVPTAYPEAMNLNMPEYSWAQGLVVVSHALRYVFCNIVTLCHLPLLQHSWIRSGVPTTCL